MCVRYFDDCVDHGAARPPWFFFEVWNRSLSWSLFPTFLPVHIPPSPGVNTHPCAGSTFTFFLPADPPLPRSFFSPISSPCDLLFPRRRRPPSCRIVCPGRLGFFSFPPLPLIYQGTPKPREFSVRSDDDWLKVGNCSEWTPCLSSSLPFFPLLLKHGNFPLP